MEEVGESIKLNPKPGYVIKTRLLKSPSMQVGTKVFLNICQDTQVPTPEQEFEPNVVFPLIVDNKWEIPIIVSREKLVKDKKGQESLCYDCCINDLCFRWCTINPDLKSILNEWCLEAVELLYSCVLDREYSIPKMLNKGELSETIIKKNELTDTGLQKTINDMKNNDSLALLEQLKDVPMEDSDPENLDIFNRGPSTKGPLIQEIEVKPHVKPAKVTYSPTEIKYTVRFQKVKSPYSLLITFDSNVAYENLKLEYEPNQLIITSTSPSFVFDIATGKSHLTIPLPHDTRTFKSFYLNNQLLVYC